LGAGLYRGPPYVHFTEGEQQPVMQLPRTDFIEDVKKDPSNDTMLRNAPTVGEWLLI